MTKAIDAFRTISEAAEELDLPQHVLRFWETRFAQIRPLKRGGGRRYYRPEDLDLLRGIRHLLYDEGYTIKGVKRIFKDKGQAWVMAIGQGQTMLEADAAHGLLDNDVSTGPVSAREPDDHHHIEPTLSNVSRTDIQVASEVPVSRPAHSVQTSHQQHEPAAPLMEPEPLSGEVPSRDVLDDPLPDAGEHKDAGGNLFSRMIRQGGRADKATDLSSNGQIAGLDHEQVERLQSVLFELLEAKRILDRSRA